MDPIESAFAHIKRENFVPGELRPHASIDAPLPIGFGQTISQPTTVRLMLQWLKVEAGNKVLDVGSGSGWSTALLAHLTGQKGHVYAVELIPELVRFGRQNVEKTGLSNVEFHQAKKTYGLAKYAPYERILVSAAAREMPRELVEQLKPGGKMVIPVDSDILEVTKKARGRAEVLKHPGFVFVPLI
jgi:protein-L-isoaspartate(D-aspartate) O-methyltransferase